MLITPNRLMNILLEMKIYRNSENTVFFGILKMISSVQLIILKILETHKEKQAAELQKIFYNANLIKSPKGIYLSLYKLRDKQMCCLNNQGLWEITETGKNFLLIVESLTK
ncbi:MAG: hypothetical protein ACKPFC_07920 [Planktothrix sp.]